MCDASSAALPFTASLGVSGHSCWVRSLGDSANGKTADSAIAKVLQYLYSEAAALHTDLIQHEHQFLQQG